MADHDRAMSALRTIAWPVYAAGVLTILLPLADLLASVWPMRLGQVEWRFGTLGLLAGFTLTPLLGMIMCMAAAAVLEHRVVQRVLAVVDVLAAVLLFAFIVIFAFDWLQYRAAAPAEARTGMDVGSIKAIIKHALVAVAFLWLGFAGWRAGRDRGGRREKRQAAPLIREPDRAAS